MQALPDFNNISVHNSGLYVQDKKYKVLKICCTLSLGWFPGIWIVCADILEHSVCSKMSAHKIQMPGNCSKKEYNCNNTV